MHCRLHKLPSQLNDGIMLHFPSSGIFLCKAWTCLYPAAAIVPDWRIRAYTVVGVVHGNIKCVLGWKNYHPTIHSSVLRVSRTTRNSLASQPAVLTDAVAGLKEEGALSKLLDPPKAFECDSPSLRTFDQSYGLLGT